MTSETNVLRGLEVLHHKAKWTLLIGTAALLASCGNQRPLVAKAGDNVPPVPYAAEESPSSTQLLRPSTQARPDRSVELRRRSEVREDDPFEMPPE